MVSTITNKEKTVNKRKNIDIYSEKTIIKEKQIDNYKSKKILEDYKKEFKEKFKKKLNEEIDCIIRNLNAFGLLLNKDKEYSNNKSILKKPIVGISPKSKLFPKIQEIFFSEDVIPIPFKTLKENIILIGPNDILLYYFVDSVDFSIQDYYDEFTRLFDMKFKFYSILIGDVSFLTSAANSGLFLKTFLDFDSTPFFVPSLKDMILLTKSLIKRLQIKKNERKYGRHIPKIKSLNQAQEFLLEGLIQTGPSKISHIKKIFKNPWEFLKTLSVYNTINIPNYGETKEMSKVNKFTKENREDHSDILTEQKEEYEKYISLQKKLISIPNIGPKYLEYNYRLLNHNFSE